MKRILISLLALFYTANAYADNVSDLMGLGMPGALAAEIDAQYGTAITASIIPLTDNAIDLGSASKNFRSLYLKGDVVFGAGPNILSAGTMILGTSTATSLILRANSLTRWTIDSTNGALTQDATNGGNIVLTKASTAVAQSAADGLTATGTTVADALQLTSVTNRVTTTASGTGVKLFDTGTTAGYTVNVINRGANALLVYPADADDGINSLADGAGFSVAAGASAVCFKAVHTAGSSSRWGCR